MFSLFLPVVWIAGLALILNISILSAQPVDGNNQNSDGMSHLPIGEIHNLPHAPYKPEDAQLNRAVNYLLEEIHKDPRKVPQHPLYPAKSFTTDKKTVG